MGLARLDVRQRAFRLEDNGEFGTEISSTVTAHLCWTEAFLL